MQKNLLLIAAACLVVTLMIIVHAEASPTQTTAQATSLYGETQIKTQDQKSYFLYWKPSQTATQRKIIISLHGRGSSAQEDLTNWYPYLKDRDFEFASLEWWFSQTPENYYTSSELYTQIEAFLAKQNITKNDLVILHGFSRGALNSYYIAASDHSNQKLLDYIIANSGGMDGNLAINQEITGGKFGKQPFLNQKFILYCGGLDPEPSTYGCPAMINTQQKITNLGAKIELFIQDKNSGHQGFLENPDNVSRALDLVDKN